MLKAERVKCGSAYAVSPVTAIAYLNPVEIGDETLLIVELDKKAVVISEADSQKRCAKIGSGCLCHHAKPIADQVGID